MSRELTSSAMKQLTEADAEVIKSKQAQSLGRYDYAEKYMSSAIKSREQALGSDDPGVAELQSELGQIYSELGNYTEANALFDQAIKKLEAAYYDGHYKLGPVYAAQTSNFIKQGQFEQAEAPAMKAQDIFSKTLTGEHRLALEATYKLALIYKQLGKFADAMKLFVKAKKAIESPMGPLDEFKYLEALIQEADGKVDEADKAFKIALDCFKKRRNFRRLASCSRRYAEFLEKQGKTQEANAAMKDAEFYDSVSGGLSRNDDMFASTLVKA